MQCHEKLIKNLTGCLFSKILQDEWPIFHCLNIDLCHSRSFANSFGIKRPDWIPCNVLCGQTGIFPRNCNGNNTAACASFSKLYSLAIEWNIYLYNTTCQLFILKHSFSFFVLFLSLFVHTYVYYTRTLIIFPPTLTHSSFLV